MGEVPGVNLSFIGGGGDLLAIARAFQWLASIYTGAWATFKHALCLGDGFGTYSRPVARIAGNEIEAERCLPDMATQAFLPCLSKPDIEGSAARAASCPARPGRQPAPPSLIGSRRSGFIYPGAAFALTADEATKLAESHVRHDGEQGSGDDDPAGAETEQGADDASPADADPAEGADAADPEEDLTEPNAPPTGMPGEFEQIAAE